MEIESYLADLEEREKQWLEKDEIVKPEEPKPPKSQLPAPPVNSQLTSTENNEIQREIPKLPNGKALMKKSYIHNPIDDSLFNFQYRNQSERAVDSVMQRL